MGDLFSLAEARQLRDEGMERAANSAAEWLNKCRETAVYLGRTKGSVSIDEVLQLCERPEWVSPNATGSVFRDKRFKLVGYKQSTKTSAHARRIGIYQLNDGD